MNVRAPTVVVRGIGIRRFAPSVFHMGAVTIEQPGVAFENVVVADSATTGISVQRENVTLSQGHHRGLGHARHPRPATPTT